MTALLERDGHAAEVGVDLQADLLAREFELGALVIGHDDHLGSLADRAAAAGCSVDPGHVAGAADMANRAAEICLGHAESQASGHGADRDRVALAMEGEGALAAGATDEEGRLVDGEADRAAVGMRGAGKADARGGDGGNRDGTKSG